MHKKFTVDGYAQEIHCWRFCWWKICSIGMYYNAFENIQEK